MSVDVDVHRDRNGRLLPGHSGLTRLSEEQIAKIRELRYEDGLSCRRVGEILGHAPHTVSHYAPGRPGKVPVAPLRERFLASPFTAAEVARALGWWNGAFGDSSRVKRTLGILPDISGRGFQSYRNLCDAEVVALIAEAIGIMPWEVMPDDDC